MIEDDIRLLKTIGYIAPFIDVAPRSSVARVTACSDINSGSNVEKDL